MTKSNNAAVKSVKSNVKAAVKASVKATASAGLVRGKTTRATMINLLFRNKGKLVSISTVKNAVQKVTGLQPETVDSRIKTRVKLVSSWAASKQMKLVVKPSGFQLLDAKN